MKNYKLTEDTKIIEGHILHKIEALREFEVSYTTGGGMYTYKIHKGQTGGYIEKEENLSQTDNCWVHTESCVYENARIQDSVMVDCSSVVSGEAIIGGTVRVGGSCKSTIIKGKSTIIENIELDNCIIEDLDLLIVPKDLLKKSCRSLKITPDFYIKTTSSEHVLGLIKKMTESERCELFRKLLEENIY